MVIIVQLNDNDFVQLTDELIAEHGAYIGMEAPGKVGEWVYWPEDTYLTAQGVFDEIGNWPDEDNGIEIEYTTGDPKPELYAVLERLKALNDKSGL